MVTQLELFAGIGGFGRAGDMVGWETVAMVEKSEWCQKVLAKNFKKANIYGDIKEFNGTEWRGKIDVVTGGFPCQPFSHAGKRRGTSDDRSLWHEMFRVICEVAPRYVVAENVLGSLDIEHGHFIKSLLADLENAGYETLPPIVLPACAVGAPHRRYRVWIVAKNTNTNGRSYGRHQKESETGHDGDAFARNGNGVHQFQTPDPHQKRQSQQSGGIGDQPKRTCNGDKDVAHAESAGFAPCAHGQREKQSWGGGLWSNWYEAATSLCGIHDGVPRRVDRHRVKRLEALGNAIVPQVAAELFKIINLLEKW